jgi:hypothetical protein
MGKEASEVYAVPLAISLFISGLNGAPDTVKDATRSEEREIQTFMMFFYMCMYIYSKKVGNFNCKKEKSTIACKMPFKNTARQTHDACGQDAVPIKSTLHRPLRLHCVC